MIIEFIIEKYLSLFHLFNLWLFIYFISESILFDTKESVLFPAILPTVLLYLLWLDRLHTKFCRVK